MIEAVRHTSKQSQFQVIVVIVGVILASLFLGAIASFKVLIFLAAILGAIVLLWQPTVGIILLIVTALFLRQGISTGSDVSLNFATLLIPVLVSIALVFILRSRRLEIVQSRTNLPLTLFLVASLLSLFIGHVTWDPSVPRDRAFTLVQLAQWAIFALSAIVFWLSGNLIKDERWLKWITMSFLVAGGIVAISLVIPVTAKLASQMTTEATSRATFWVLLFSLAGGQLLFNRKLPRPLQMFLIFVILACLIYAMVVQRASISIWIGVGAALSVLLWLRWPRLRWVAMGALIILITSGVLYETVWNLAGGQIEWQASGESRLVLMERVVEVTMRNPITGLGPVAYRRYTAMTPLLYGRALWLQPQISSHNNYIDIFSQSGLIGLTFFLWFIVELAMVGIRLIRKSQTGFASGYTQGMLAAGAGALIIMLLADWILPFVYNIGFPGFQASVLIWLFMGGLVALENLSESEKSEGNDDAPKSVKMLT